MPKYYAIHKADGELVSVASVLADPLPKDTVAQLLTDEEAKSLIHEGGLWDKDNLAVIPVEPPPTQEDELLKLKAQNEALFTVIDEKDVLTKEEIDEIKAIDGKE